MGKNFTPKILRPWLIRYTVSTALQNVLLSLTQQEDMNGLLVSTVPRGIIPITLGNTGMFIASHTFSCLMRISDGVLGTILIHGPATVNYDEDLGTFPISDLYQNNMWLTGLAAERGGPPRAKGATINGTMKNAAGGGAYANVVIEQGKKYRLRLVNTAVDAGWKVSLDNHIFREF